MDSFLPDDIELKAAFGTILSIESFSKYVNEIVELIYYSELNRSSLDKVLNTYGIKRIDEIKEELLDLLLVYINIILNDNSINENEARNIKILKKVFRIIEGDFFRCRYDELQDVLFRQFNQIYFDNRVDNDEALLKVGLQELFDLSYDQFTKLVNVEAKSALERGANLDDLDTVIKLPEVIKAISNAVGRNISKEVKELVWHRDNATCARCGSEKHLQFAAIVPYLKGGANTYRNTHLLCETCSKKELLGG